MRRDINLVADHVDIEVRYSTSNKPSDHVNDFFTSNYYIGFVEDEPRSHVICYFEKNDTLNNELMPLIYAQIQIQNDNENIIYYIEPLLDTNNQNKNKYLVYRIDDIQSDIIYNNIFKYANFYFPFENNELISLFILKKILAKQYVNQSMLMI